MATCRWVLNDAVMVRVPDAWASDQNRASPRVAAFDFDGTLVRYSGPGKCWASLGTEGWSWFNDNVAPRLKALHADGYRVCVFSNQAGILRDHKRAAAVRARVDHFLAAMPEVPVLVLVAADFGKHRKPNPGMWQMLASVYSAGAPPDASASFYVGDAAGRPDDFSDSDLEFARRTGVGRFATPEEFFAAIPPP